jgi:hypothetical protein
MTTREFAKGIIALERQLLPHTCDFDTEPPEALITALTQHSGYRRSELERLIVRPYPRLSSLLVTPERAARPNAHLISLKG